MKHNTLNNLFRIFKEVLLLTALVYLFLLSFTGRLYRLFVPYLEVGWSYILDQGLPIIVPLLFGCIVIKRKDLFAVFKKHWIPILIICVTVLLAHGYILKSYFFAEDILHILSPVNNNHPEFAFAPTNNGYPMLPLILSFKLFGIQATYYNLFSLLLFLICSLTTYFFLWLLFKQQWAALIGSLFFSTTPAFLDMFSWQGSVQGMSLALALGLFSLIFLVLYQNNHNFRFQILSFLFFGTALKTGFVRNAGFIFIIAFLIWIKPWEGISTIGRKIKISLIYLALWLEFVILSYGYQFLLAPLQWLNNTSASVKTAGFLPFVSYYLMHLFLSSDAARRVIPLTSSVIKYLSAGTLKPQSIIMLDGTIIMVLFGIVTFLILLLRKTSFHWKPLLGIIWIVANLFYLPFFTLGATSKVGLYDSYFVRNSPPYGPGSRYVFVPAVGMAILFSFLYFQLSRFKYAKYLLTVLFSSIFLINIYFSISSHHHIITHISQPDRIFLEHFFTMVPRDGKPKLVYCSNPQSNMLDNVIGRWQWLWGFYKSDELTYAKNYQEVKELFVKEKYLVENIYAFYTNPLTGSFQDISDQFRKQLVNDQIPGGKEELLKQIVAFPTNSVSSSFASFSMDGDTHYTLKRAILYSNTIKKRKISPIELSLSLAVTGLDLPVSNSFSDIVFKDRSYLIPLRLWDFFEQYPAVILTSIQDAPDNLFQFVISQATPISLPKIDKRKLREILRNREYLQNNIKLTVSSLDLTETRASVRSLTDGLYTNEPYPTESQSFFLAGQTPTTLELVLPYAIDLGRVLLNTGKVYVGEHLPTRVDILASEDGKRYLLVGSLEKKTNSKWSPNNGYLTQIITQQALAKYLKIVIYQTSGKPVMLDEIVVDDIHALPFTPQTIFDYQRFAFSYVEDADAYNELLALPSYNKMTILTACTEEDDWTKQEQSKEFLIPGVWQAKTFSLSSLPWSGTLKTAINCLGSMLQRIILVGPPFPIRLQVREAIIQ